MKSTLGKQSGSLLIEALVALVVVTVGTFGVLKLNSVMLSGTGLSKTRAEALQLAQTRLENIRNFPQGTGCPAAGVSTENNTVSGVNAIYKVGTTINSVATERVDIAIYVAWQSGVSDPRTADVDKLIVLKSVVNCMDTGTSGYIGGTASSNTAGNVKTPTGAARVGGRNYGPSNTNGTVNVIPGSTTNDGTKTYLAADNVMELIDATTGKVLLSVDDGSAFSTISGRVYIDNAVSSADPFGASVTDVNDDNIFVLSSDASYCARVAVSPLPVIPTGSTGNNIKLKYFDYNCYVSKGWWGNIGILRLDAAQNQEKVCVGDVAVLSSETSLWSRKTQPSVNRGYRSYREVGLVDGVMTYETIGVGLDTTTGESYTAVQIPSAANAASEHHDFLMTAYTGQGSCQTKWEVVTGQSTGNQGKFYCMSGQCPGVTQTTSSPSTVVHGTITQGPGAVITLPTDVDCTTSTFTGGNGTYTYQCVLNWSGFAGSAWHGSINFGATGTNTLCPSENTAGVLPTGNNVAFTVNGRSASPNPNSLTFTDVPVSVTDVTINFTAAAEFCSNLGMPAIAWGTGLNKGNLEWATIPNASGYKAATCTSTSGSCTPSGSTYVASPYTPTTPTAGNTTCTTITSTDSTDTYADTVSAVKCVTAPAGNGNNLNYN